MTANSKNLFGAGVSGKYFPMIKLTPLTNRYYFPAPSLLSFLLYYLCSILLGLL